MKCIRPGLSRCANCQDRFAVIVDTVDDDLLTLCFDSYEKAHDCFLDCDTIGFTHDTYVLKGTAVTFVPLWYKKGV